MMKTLFLALVLAATSLQADVTGTLIDEKGKPLVGATIRALAAEDLHATRARLLAGGEALPVIATAQSGENGAFRIETKTPLTQLLFEAPGMQPRGIEVPDGEDVRNAVLSPSRSRKIRIVANRKGVANAIVASEAYVVRSNAEGFVDLPFASGRLFIVHPDYAPMSSFAVPDESSSNDVSLSSGVAVRGRVLSADGRPVANATVCVAGWPLARSAEDGSFTISHAPTNWRTLVATDATRAAAVTNTRAASYELRLKPAASISGSTSPAARVILTLGGDREGNDSVIADAQGNYSSGPLSPSRYSISASRRGFAPSNAEVTLRESERVSRAMSLKAAQRVRGRVLDENKEPLAGAFVWIGNGGFPPRQEIAITDAGGLFDVRGITQDPTNRIIVFAVKPGYAQAAYGPVPENKTDVTLTVPRGFPLQVRVIDKQRTGVSGAYISVMREAEGEPYGARETATCEEPLVATCRTTGSDGAVRLRATEGMYRVGVYAQSLVPRNAPPQNITARTSPLIIEIDRGVEISGRVLFADGTPASEATVYSRGLFNTATRASADGTFTMRNVPAGRVTLTASDGPRMEAAAVEVAAPAHDVTLTIPTPARIEGRVIDKATNRPITDFQIVFRGRDSRGANVQQPSAFHSEDGSFVIPQVAPGPLDLQIAAPSYARATIGDLVAEEGKTLRAGDIGLDRGGQVRGKVSAGGQPVAGVSVRFGQGRFMGMDLNATSTDDSGEYFIEGLAIGERTIDFFKEGFLARHKNVEVTRDKEVRLDVELDRGKSLQGRVVDKSGSAVAGARVVAVSPGTGGSSGRPVITDASGSFTIEALADGRYMINAQKEGYVEARSNDVSVPATAPIVLTLDAGGTIRGRVTGLTEAELANVDVTTYGAGSGGHARVSTDGTFVIRGVPDGHIFVSAYARGARNRQAGPEAVDVKGGSAPDVVIDFNQGITIAGRVTRNGMPFSGGGVAFSMQGKPGRNSGIAPDGTYEVSGLTPGEYQVFVNGPMGTMVRTKYTVAGNSTFDIAIEGMTLRGRVVDASTGSPIAEATVYVFGSKPVAISRYGNTDSNGRFTIDAVPDGTFDVRASTHLHYSPATQSITVAGGTAPDLELRMQTAQATVFHVVDAQSGVPIDANISVSNGKTTVGPGGQRDDDGVVRVYVAAGSYKAFVNARGYVPQTVDFMVPGPDVRVMLTAGGRLMLIASHPTRVRIALPPRAAPAVFMATPYGSPMDGIPAGSYTLEVLSEDGKSVLKTIPVSVISGQMTTVNVD